MEDFKEIKTQIITNMYYDLCMKYVEIAKAHPGEIVKDFPESIKLFTVMNWLEENYQEYIIKP